jgi:hypothetical protein
LIADLLYPDQQDPVGMDHGGNFRGTRSYTLNADRARYIVWIDTNRPHAPTERAPRQAFHLTVRNGGAPGQPS